MQRREFLAAAASAGAALALPDSADAQAPDARPSQQRSIWVDAQGESPGWTKEPGGRVTPTPQLLDAIRQRRLDVLNATVAEPGNGPDRFRSAIDSIAI